MEDNLSSDLFEFLLDEHYEVPAGNQRRQSVWLMHPSWYDDCKKLEKWEGPAYDFLFGHSGLGQRRLRSARTTDPWN